MDPITETRKLAEANALTFTDHGGGHVQIEGHGTLVNYWPESKRRTAHVKGGESVPHCSPWDAVRLCLTTGKPGLKPKKVTTNRPQVDLKETVTNPAGLVHLYDGDTPPWEFPTFIMAQSDELRLQAHSLRCEADVLDHINQ